MSNDWFCKIGDVPYGPMTSAEIRRMASLGKLGPTDYVCRGEAHKWVRAGRVKGLQFKQSSSATVHSSDLHDTAKPASDRRTLSARNSGGQHELAGTPSFRMFVVIPLTAFFLLMQLLVIYGIVASVKASEMWFTLTIFVVAPNVVCLLTSVFARYKGYSFWAWYIAGGIGCVTWPILLLLPRVDASGDTKGDQIGDLISTLLGIIYLGIAVFVVIRQLT